MGPMPPGVSVMGLVKDLTPLYRDAGVIISPLRIGSGLKVKLIEALSHGKSIVGTARTLQGVEEQLADAILVADEPIQTIDVGRGGAPDEKYSIILSGLRSVSWPRRKRRDNYLMVGQAILNEFRFLPLNR